MIPFNFSPILPPKKKRKNNLMLRAFNSFQIVAAFVAWPFLISYLSGATFQGAGAAFYGACALYVVAFGVMVACVANTLEDL